MAYPSDRIARRPTERPFAPEPRESSKPFAPKGSARASHYGVEPLHVTIEVEASAASRKKEMNRHHTNPEKTQHIDNREESAVQTEGTERRKTTQDQRQMHQWSRLRLRFVVFAFTRMYLSAPAA